MVSLVSHFGTINWSMMFDRLAYLGIAMVSKVDLNGKGDMASILGLLILKWLLDLRDSYYDPFSCFGDGALVLVQKI